MYRLLRNLVATRRCIRTEHDFAARRVWLQLRVHSPGGRSENRKRKTRSRRRQNPLRRTLKGSLYYDDDQLHSPSRPSPHCLVFFLLLPHTNPSTPRSLSSSSSSSSTTPDHPTLTYLIDSCGLTHESAIVAARKRAPLRSTENPNAVLCLLRGSFGFSGESLVRVLTAYPVLLKRSLANHIIPCFTFLRTLLASVFSHEPQGLNSGLDSVILPVLGVLRRHDLPEERISKLVKILPRILILPPRRVNEIVEEVKAAGVLPADLAFIYAFRAQKRANWHRKIAAFQSSGLRAISGEASSFFWAG